MPGPTAAGGFLRYVRHAFVYHWNLLALGAGIAAALISGRAEVALPILAAGELVYLAGLSSHRRFQAAIDAADLQTHSGRAAVEATAKMMEMLAGLGPEDRARFERLRGQCLALREIAVRVKGDVTEVAAAVDPLQAGGINRLLWIYLKLLFSKQALERFFATIDVRDIEGDLARATERLAQLPPEATASETDQRRRASLEDHLRTSTARLANFRRAEENHAFIQDEIDRLSVKIASLAELAISRQDPNFITSEVDSVSQSVESSEKAMSELEFLTGFHAVDEAAPPILDLETERPA